jgi:hypothetical protein
MPKTFLASFIQFEQTLLPHQIEWIVCINLMRDPEKIRILNLLHHNLLQPKKAHPYPYTIDKRKYSFIRKYIEEKLKTIDVDLFYSWLCETDRKIMTDNLSLDDERHIVRYIKNYSHPNYYFLRFYELMQNYRHFLLIRVRHENYNIIGEFLQKYEHAYKRGQAVYQQLHDATYDIVSQYKFLNEDGQKWEQILIDVFDDESLDGLNRYFAIVRLTFLYYNYKEYGRLLELYDKLDQLFIQGKLYSPRILVNYYANRLLVHARENDLQKAINYGFLSVRFKSNDYLQYINNLSAVLMRNGQHKDALDLLTKAFPDFRKTLSSHNRIGFASFYIQALIRNKRANEAVSYASSFLDKYRDDILRNRWHIFFTSYVFALLETEKYSKIISIEKKFNLLPKEESYRKKAGYIPSFIWIYELARYKELTIGTDQLYESLYQTSLPIIPDAHRFRLMKEMCNELMPHQPDVFQKLSDKLFKYSTYKVTPRFTV